MEPFFVVGVTAFTNQEAVSTCLQAGMNEIIEKPVSLQKIKQILDKYYFESDQKASSIGF